LPRKHILDVQSFTEYILAKFHEKHAWTRWQVTIKKVQDTERRETCLLPLEQQLLKRVRRSVQSKCSEIQANNCDKNKKWVQSESGEWDGNQEMLISIPGSKFL